jgi:hypothetical protein
LHLQGAVRAHALRHAARAVAEQHFAPCQKVARGVAGAQRRKAVRGEGLHGGE